MQENKRVEWLDVARGIGIIFVVLGHTATSCIRADVLWVREMYKYIFYFHMPFLFFLSGYALNIHSKRYLSLGIKEYVSKKIKSLLIPYFSFACIIYLIFEIGNHLPVIGLMMEKVGYGNVPLATFLIQLVVGNNEFSIHLWFIYVLFIYEIIAYFFMKNALLKRVFLVIGLVITLLEMRFYWFTGFSLAWSDGLLYMFWFVLGMNIKTPKISRMKILLSILLWNVLYVIHNSVSVKLYFLDVILWIVVVLCATISIIGISQMCVGAIKDKCIFLGRRTMIIYLLHQPFFGSAFGTIMYKILHVNSLVIVICSFVLSLGVPLLVNTIFNRFKLFRIIIGAK